MAARKQRGRWVKVGEVDTALSANLMIADPARDPRTLPEYEALVGLKVQPFVSVVMRPKDEPNDWLIIQAKDLVHQNKCAIVVNTHEEAGYPVYARIVKGGEGWPSSERVAELRIDFDYDVEESAELTPEQVKRTLDRQRT